MLSLVSISSMAISNSETFSYLEKETLERLQFIKKENALTNEAVKKTKEYRAIDTELKAIDLTPLTMANYSTPYGALEIKFQGHGKPIIVNRLQNNSSTILFNSFTLDKKDTFQYESSSLSPRGDYLAIAFYHQGETEDFYYVVLDVQTGTILFQQTIYDTEGILSWVSPCEFLFNDKITAYSEDLYRTFNLQTNETRTLGNIETISQHRYFVKIKEKNRDPYIVNGEGEIFPDPENKVSVSSIIFFNKNDLYIKGSQYFPENQTHQIKIDKITLDQNGHHQIQPIIQLKNEVFSIAQNLNGYLGIVSNWGLTRKLRIVREDGVIIFEKEIPPDYIYTFSKWIIPGKKLEIKITGPKDSELKTIALDDSSIDFNPKESLWNFMGLKLKIISKMVPSLDGTMIPIQMISRIDNDETTTHHAFIYAYGGFNAAGYLFNFGSLYQYVPFLKRGGIVVLTGVRGGNEFGTKWYLDAAKENKGKTFEDVAGVAKFLIDEKISEKEKVSLFGSSNGGFVSAATGLLYPDYFGLIIPHAGVHDHLKKRVLDSRYDGWIEEYLDENNPEERALIPAMSPLELAKNPNHVKMLILHERNDSRVNPVHSYKLTMAQKRSSDRPTHFYSINNYGHFGQHYTISNMASTRLWTVIWSFVFAEE